MIHKVTPQELRALFSHGVKGIGVFIFTEDSFEFPYPKVSRAYAFGSGNKFFDPRKLGSSLYGNCLDGKDNGVRLDWYMSLSSRRPWVPEEAYIVDEEGLDALREQLSNEQGGSL